MPTGTSARRQFLLPDLGEGLTEAEVARWLVAVGDVVEVDQPVAEVETAKAVVEVPCPFAGVVAELHAEVGGEVAVGAPLITIETATAGSQEAQAAEASPEQAAHEAGGGDSGNVLVGYGTAGHRRSRRRRSGSWSSPGGSGPGGSARGEGGEQAPQAPSRPLAKPPVRKLAKELGVDLAEVSPSGDGGVITREDVRAHAQRRVESRAGAPTAAVAEGMRRLPLTGVRKLIAQRMTTSRREIPEATAWVDCDATALMAARDEINASQSQVRVSPLVLVLRACVAGLRRFPQLNARLDEEAGEIVLFDAVHLGIATQTERGLVVPVIRDAHTRSTLELAQALHELAARARDANVEPRQLVGSTFSVSNYGSFGVDGGNPVINHPEAAILGVGQIVERPWVVSSELAVRQVVQLSVAFDHRIADGGEAAGFLRFVADCVERPSTLLAHL